MFAPGPLELLVIAAIFVVTLLVPIGIVFAILFALKVGPFQRPNPELRACPDCGGQVSRHATSCPHCGRPLEAAP